MSTSESLGLYTSSYKFMFSMKLRETYPVCQKQMGTFSINLAKSHVSHIYNVRCFFAILVSELPPWTRDALEAMESLLRRWDRCAESRRQLVETQVGQVLGEAREMVEEVKISDVCCLLLGNTLEIHWQYMGNTRKQLMFKR